MMKKSQSRDEAAAAVDGAAAAAVHRRVVRWERFLPRRSLRVLLVEHDDSTRQIVTVLLRKCSYQVAAVADGLKAWEVLKERHFNIDLVLTEVAMPSLSGIGLLSEIMGTEECKNIPVIMMSSQDAIGVVLKCMLKGAVDFLVKPVRKNELRNLWQHVWRKHCASSYANASDNNAASNHISANGEARSKSGKNSDERTDTESSGSKPNTEVVSNKKHIECQVADGRSLSREEATREQSDNNIVILTSVPKAAEDKPIRNGFKLTRPLHETPRTDKIQEQNCSYYISPYRREKLDCMTSREGYQNKAPNELVQDMANLVEPSANEQCSSRFLGKDALKQDARMQNISSCGKSLLLELSLRRPQLDACTQEESKERLILNHSNSSAFSRYNDKRIHTSCENLVPSVSDFGTHACNHGAGNENNAPLLPKERFSSYQGNVGENSCYVQLFSKSNDGELLSSDMPRDDAYADHSATGDGTVFRYPQYGFIPLPIPFGSAPYQNLCAGYEAILQPMFYPETSFSPHSSAAPEKQTIQIPSDHQRRLIDMEPRVPRDASCTPMGHAYQSGSCSQDILRGSCSYGTGETTDAVGNTGTALESGNESGVQNCTCTGLDCDHSRREAALMKFRLKRKERCFEKKVRYYNRKKLAEQRPRVKGQFVRQNMPDPAVETEADD